MKNYGLYINGEWIQSSSGKTFETKNPADDQTLAIFQKGTEKDVMKAVEAAERTFPQWRKFPPPKRGEILLKAAAIMRERKEELGKMVTQEMGKVIAEGKGDVQEAIDFLEYISGEGRRLLGETTPSELPNKLCLTLKQPIGVVGCITPLEFPHGRPLLEIGGGLDHRERDCLQTGHVDAPLRRHAGGDLPAGRASCGRPQYGHRIRRGCGRGHRPTSQRPRGLFHGQRGCRERYLCEGLTNAEKSGAGIGGQESSNRHG